MIYSIKCFIEREGRGNKANFKNWKEGKGRVNQEIEKSHRDVIHHISDGKYIYERFYIFMV